MRISDEEQNVRKIILLVSIACVLQLAESMLPQPVPGMRIGLANMMTLVALDSLGLALALEVAFLRTVLSALIMGTFLSFPFILSFSGALASTLAMGFFFWLAGSRNIRNLSMVGISIIGALVHNLVQLALVYFLLVKHKGIFIFLPWLCAAAVIAGWITGAAAADICRKIKEKQGAAEEEKFVLPPGIFQTAPDIFSRNRGTKNIRSAQIKIFMALLLILPALVVNKLMIYAGLFLTLAGLILFLRLPLVRILESAGRYQALTLSAFLLPVFFNNGSQALFDILWLKVTAEGVYAGAVFFLRLNFLILASTVVFFSAPAEEIIFALARFFRPMRVFGLSERKIAAVLFLSWSAVPALLEAARNILRENKLKKTKRLREIIPLLGDFAAALFLAAGKPASFGSSGNFKNIIESIAAKRV